MSDLQRAIRIGQLLTEAKSICDAGQRQTTGGDKRLGEIAAECNRLHAEMSEESKAALDQPDFANELPILTGWKGGAL